MIATMTDNRKLQYDSQNRKYLYLWNYDKYRLNYNGNSGVFDHDEFWAGILQFPLSVSEAIIWGHFI